MNQSDFVAKLANTLGVTNAEAKRTLDTVTTSIADVVASGDDVTIAGFGKFAPKKRDARTGRNPATGETINIAASTSCGFSPAKALKDRLNG